MRAPAQALSTFTGEACRRYERMDTAAVCQYLANTLKQAHSEDLLVLKALIAGMTVRSLASAAVWLSGAAGPRSLGSKSIRCASSSLLSVHSPEDQFRLVCKLDASLVPGVTKMHTCKQQMFGLILPASAGPRAGERPEHGAGGGAGRRARPAAGGHPAADVLAGGAALPARPRARHAAPLVRAAARAHAL